MKYKILLMAVLLMQASLGHGAASHVVGTWKCNFKSEVIDAKQSITINGDGTYEVVADVFGSQLVDIGTWSLRNDTLTFNRHTHIARNKKQSSKYTFTHKIKKLDKATLVMTYGKGISECSR